MGLRELARAPGPKTGTFINIARGPIADQTALTKVLRERRIAGARQALRLR